MCVWERVIESDRQQYLEREREKTRVYKTVENLRKKKQRTELRI